MLVVNHRYRPLAVKSLLFKVTTTQKTAIGTNGLEKLVSLVDRMEKPTVNTFSVWNLQEVVEEFPNTPVFIKEIEPGWYRVLITSNGDAREYCVGALPIMFDLRYSVAVILSQHALAYLQVQLMSEQANVEIF